MSKYANWKHQIGAWLDSTRLEFNSIGLSNDREKHQLTQTHCIIYTNSNLNKLPVMYRIKIMFLNSLSLVSCEKIWVEGRVKVNFCQFKKWKKKSFLWTKTIFFLFCFIVDQSSVHKSKHASALQSLAGYLPSEKKTCSAYDARLIFLTNLIYSE